MAKHPNTFSCGGVTYDSAAQAARFVENGCEVQIVQGNTVVGHAWLECAEPERRRYVMRSRRTGDHVLSADHTDTERLAAHLSGFAQAPEGTP